MGDPHAFDVALTAHHLHGLASPDALAAFFAQLGYPTDSRLEQLPEHLGVPQRLRGELRRIERLAADADGLEVYLFELRSVTVAATRVLCRTLRDRGGDFLLVLASIDYDRLDFVLLERVGPEVPATGISAPRVGIRPRVLTLDRRHPGSRQVRVLRRFTWTEADAFAQFEKIRSAYDLAEGGGAGAFATAMGGLRGCRRASMSAGAHAATSPSVPALPHLPSGIAARHGDLIGPGKHTVSSKGQITVPVEVRKRLGLVPGTPVVFELREEGVLLRKGVSGSHPVDRVWATLRLGRPVDDLLDEMRGPRPRKK